jgi:uncharacterized membrane protein AbrB (regulator of aidB expression)
MTSQHRSGSSTVEYVLMLAILTAIGYLIMSLMTNPDPTSSSGVIAGQTAAVSAISND